MTHPGTLQELVESVFCCGFLDSKLGWIGEIESTVQIVDPVLPEGSLVDIKRVAAVVPLGPVSDIMEVDHRKGPTHTHEGPEID